MRRIVCAFVLLFLCAGSLNGLAPAALYANGNTPPDESKREDDPGAEIKERQKKLEAEKRAREKRLAEARQRAAAQKAAERKKAAAAQSAVPAEPSSEDIASAMLLSGRNLVEEGRYERAVQSLGDFLKANPRSADGWYWISRAHHALGDYDRAQLAVNIALQIDPHYPALAKTPNGLQPATKLTKQTKKEPRPQMSVLPVKPPLPAGLSLAPVTISFPVLMNESDPMASSPDVAGEDFRDPVTGAWLRYDPYPPLDAARVVSWQQSERFGEISRWRFRVDRVAILKDPRVPIAWKGSHPYEVYFWTGTEWARVRREKEGFDWVERYDDILYRAQEDIRAILEERNFRWFEQDTPSLAANASLMRYWWLGDIDLGDAKERSEKRQRDAVMTAPTEETRKRSNAK